MKPWYRLNIDIETAITVRGYDVIDSWKQQAQTAGVGYWKLYKDSGLDDFFSAEFLSRMDAQGIPIDMAVFFYRSQNYNHPTAHIDGSLSHKPYYALNWVLTSGPDDSEMIWFEIPENLGPPVTGDYGTANYDIDQSNLRKIDSCCIGNQMTLVRVDAPHNVIVRQQSRFVISLRSRLLQFQSWQQAVEHFQSLIIE